MLLDLNLGAENGLDVLAKIQKLRPHMAVVIITAVGTIGAAVEAMRLGALDFIEKPFTSAQFGMTMARVLNHRKLAGRVVELETQVAAQAPALIFETGSPAVRKSLDVLFRAANTPASILILGKSGTGKSIIARAVHERSTRSTKPFVTISCPSLTKELLESELFGHMRGSFTGAMKDHWGKVKAAEGGTLFIDEIGELPLEIQPKLLRLLQEQEYERVGENITRKSDLRIISATNRDLAAAVRDGTFREDLFYRLNVITVEMPSLSERQEDLQRFADSYLQFFARHFARPVRDFSEDANRYLQAYSWPGNLRELRNVIERAVILCDGPMIEPRDLPTTLLGATPTAPNGKAIAGGFVSLEDLESAHIRHVLDRTSSLNEAAKVLGIDQATLYRKRKKLEPCAD